MWEAGQPQVLRGACEEEEGRAAAPAPGKLSRAGLPWPAAAHPAPRPGEMLRAGSPRSPGSAERGEAAAAAASCGRDEVTPSIRSPSCGNTLNCWAVI